MRVHWLFVALLAGAMMVGYGLQALILLGSLAAHEIAHLAAAWVLGVGVQSVTLTPFGGLARMDEALESDPQAEVAIAVAGPFQSFFLAGLAHFLAGSDLWDQHLLRFCFEINASLAFFNLIPALPLDGGRALRGMLAQRYGYRRVTRWMVRLGRVCGLAMALAALFVFVGTGRVYATPLVGGSFLALGAAREWEMVAYRAYQHFLRKRERLAGRGVLDARQLVAVEGTKLKEVLEHLSTRKYHMVLVVDAQLNPLGTLHESELMDAFRVLGPEARVEAILEL